MPLPTATPEQELMLLLCGTPARRRRHQRRIRELTQQVDFELLSSRLAGQGLLPLGATRLLETAPRFVPDQVRSSFTELTQGASRRGLLLETLTLQFQADLERAGVAALPLKGPVLARALYGDAGIRMTVDLDLLVRLEQLDLAVKTIAARGFSLQRDVSETGGLPLLHQRLTHDAGQLPPVELHWRVHWYESRFSRDMLDRSIETRDGRRARPEDELASLLLFYARDGFVGLRLAADIATWWGRNGHEMKSPVLGATINDYPELRSALIVTAGLLEGLVGIPRGSLVSSSDRQGWSQRTATRLANWPAVGDPDQVSANVTFIDWLLTPRSGWLQFARRALVPPRAAIESMYGLAEDAHWRRLWSRVVHGPKLALRYLIALWRVRRHRPWAPLPGSIDAMGDPGSPPQSEGVRSSGPLPAQAEVSTR